MHRDFWHDKLTGLDSDTIFMKYHHESSFIWIVSWIQNFFWDAVGPQSHRAKHSLMQVVYPAAFIHLVRPLLLVWLISSSFQMRSYRSNLCTVYSWIEKRKKKTAKPYHLLQGCAHKPCLSSCHGDISRLDDFKVGFLCEMGSTERKWWSWKTDERDQTADDTFLVFVFLLIIDRNSWIQIIQFADWHRPLWLWLVKGFCKFPPIFNLCCLWLDVCASVPSDTEFPWRQVRPSASKDDMKRWTTALHSLHLRTLTMTSPAVTALTAATASIPLPALHLPVRNHRRQTLKKAIYSKTHSNR